jgi:beta-galactosidase
MVRSKSYKISRRDATTQCASFPGMSLQAFHSCGNIFFLCCVFSLLSINAFSQRQDISLNNDWLTSLNTTDEWKKVNIPHNWDDYYGYRRLVHGNLHGDATYKKDFRIKQAKQGKRFFLFFEGVGSYASVYLNDKFVGSHAGGRTTFTLDITGAIKTDGSQNSLLIKVAHPSNIKDLPWVCGGCSDERGFSEGSQPIGIFRPVHLIVTNATYIAPFGVHAWADIRDGKATLTIETTIRRSSFQTKQIIILYRLVDRTGKTIMAVSRPQPVKTNDSIFTTRASMVAVDPVLWSIENPYLYKIVTTVRENNSIVDEVKTDFGFRTIEWKTATHQFLLNGKPVFINGIGEYEHLLGQSHAFSNEQIKSRMKWVKAAGFNAFREAHQPHNLLYIRLCDESGLLLWSQFSAHIWYDSPEFRKNFLQLLEDWVIERRNDPAVILWGLQNESKLPDDFARQCTELIRSLDPTASSQRLVTTCNGGSGTDWDVPQNWTGTYGGDPNTYASDIKKQVLVGEYGAWRTIDLHTEGGFVQNGVVSEDRMTQLMEQKIRLAESVKDSCAGQFFWLLSSHDNPGRVQGGEGLRELDRIGPVNYKGLLTAWEEPTDAFYMFRSNYAPKEKEPMVYIVSHTWPNRWMKPGIKDSIIVYSNCDEVELFNDIDNVSLGKQKRKGIGTHFQWDRVNIRYNVLYAVGYVKGKIKAWDTIVLNHLPQAPGVNKLYKTAGSIVKPQLHYSYVYRINCGGPAYVDENGNTWSADKGFSKSWADDFPEMPGDFASQRRTFDPVRGTRDWKLFQDFRYGKDKLQYDLGLPNGEYLVELYFIEPWLGIGGSMNAKEMRLFDVAVNGKTVLNDLDIWNEAGTNTALKKIVKAKITGGKMVISFPESKAGQAIISAIAIAHLNKSTGLIIDKELIPYLRTQANGYKLESWLDIGDKQYIDENVLFNSLPPNLYGADWFSFVSKSVAGKISFKTEAATNVFVGCLKTREKIAAVNDFENTGTEIITDENGGAVYTVYRKLFEKDQDILLDVSPDCIVIMQPVNKMQPAYDLKPVTSYRTNVAVISEGVQKEKFAGRESIVVKTDDPVNVQWPIQTGVADMYSITVRYYYPREKELNGTLQLIGAGNNRMLEEPVSFKFTRDGKWNQFTINTSGMINAGNYIVRLETNDAKDLVVSGIDIQ